MSHSADSKKPLTLIALSTVVFLLCLGVRKSSQFKEAEPTMQEPSSATATTDQGNVDLRIPKHLGKSDSSSLSPLYEELASDRLYSEDFQAWRKLVHDFETDGAIAAVTLKVVDETGKPVPSANVKMSFTTPGGKGKYKSNTGLTDSDGQFVSKGRTCWSVVWRVEKNGYHTCWSNLYLRPYVSVQGRREGKWFRSPFPVTTVLRKKVSPHNMRVYDGEVSLPLLGDAVGFDLVDGKPMPPHGKGRHCDIEFSALHNPDEWGRNSKVDSVSIVKITFSGNGNGGIIVTKDEFCDLDTPRDAPEDGYETLLESTTSFIGGKYSEAGRIQPNQYIIFKIRGENGDERNSRYGKIQGAWHVNGPRRQLWFRVWINEEPGNRNLEYDCGWKQLQEPER